MDNYMEINERIIDLERKIDILKNQDIQRLESELLALKQELRTSGVVAPKSTQEQAVSMPIEPQVRKEARNVKETSKFDLENKFGQNIMGILASLLIFVGLGFFVVLIYEYLTDAIKVFGMYTLSTSILILGLFLLKKKSNIFSLSLTGCGIGSIYLSILMTNVYFNYIGDFLMYGLILVWFFGIIYLSRRLTEGINTVNIIGQIGVFISVVLGAESFSTTQELFLIAFFLMATSLVHWIMNNGEGKEILKNISIFTISLSSMIIASNLPNKIFHSEPALVINPFVVAILGMIIIGYNLFINVTYYDNNKSNALLKGLIIFVTSIFLVISLQDFYYVVSRTLDLSDKLMEIFILTLLTVVIYAISEIKGKSKLIRIGTFLILQFYLIAFNIELGITPYIGLALLFVPYLIYGQLGKDKLYTFMGYMYLAFDVIFLFSSGHTESHTWSMMEYFIILLVVGFLYTNMIIDKNSYKIRHKLTCYILLLIATAKVFVIPGFKEPGVLSYTIVAILSVLIYLSVFVCDWRTAKGFLKANNEVEKKVEFTCNIINHILLLIIGLVGIYDTNTFVGQIVMIFGLCLVCLADNSYLLEKYKNSRFIGFYIGIKLTILINTIMYSFTYMSNNSYLISLSCLVLAVAVIIIGFKLSVKSLRVYGLLLSMIGIFKLLLVDIQYDNSIGRVISFIFAGILCFGINFLYSAASKKMSK